MSDRARGLLLLAAVFVCGGVVGGALVQFRTARVVRQVIDGPPSGFEARLKLLLMERGLGLSADQEARIRPILDDAAARSRAVRETIEPQLAPIRASERDAVRTLLTSDQRREYDRHMADIDTALGRRR